MLELPIKLARGTAYETGALFPEDLTISEWMAEGVALNKVHNKYQFSIGDWLNFGTRKYGERYKVACEETGIPYQTLRNYAWVCNQIEMSRRRDNLQFSHHAEIAAIKGTDEQNKWLDWANGKTVEELREELRNSVAEFAGEDHGKPVKTFAGFLTNAIRLIGQQGEQIKLWSPEQKIRTKEMLRPLVEFYERL